MLFSRTSRMETIFGIDAGLTAPGFAIVRRQTDRPDDFGAVLHAECFLPDAERVGSKSTYDADRIAQIVTRIVELSDQYAVSRFACELPTGGAKSSAAVRGMAFSTAMSVSAITCIRLARPTVSVQYVTPIQSKKASSGIGARHTDADQGKWDVFQAVNAVWRYEDWPKKRRKSHQHLLDDSRCWAIADALSAILTDLKLRQGAG